MNMSTKRLLHPRRRGSQLFVAILICTAAIMFAGSGGYVAYAAGPPAANGPLTATTNEDTVVTINTGITANSAYEVRHVEQGTGPAHGTVSQGPTVGGNFTLNYAPGANQTAAVTFRYAICVINQGPCGTSAQVTVTINAVNDAPTADDDAATTPEDTAVTINVLDGDTGGPADENQTLSIVNVSDPANGTAVVSGGQVIYTPDADFCGTGAYADTFTYQAQDTGGLKSGAQPPATPTFATVTVDVTCVNDKPKAVADTATVVEDSTNNPIVVLDDDSRGPVGAGEGDESGQTLSLIDIPTPPTNGTAAINGNVIDYTPTPDFCGTDSFEYRIEDDATIDGVAKRDKGRVDVTVTCEVDKPYLAIENVSAVTNHMFTIDIVLHSPDKDISGVNFDLDYGCLMNPDVDPNSTPPVPPFYINAQDSGGILGVLIGSQVNPPAILAGPSGSSMITLATVKFTVDPTCVSNNDAGVELAIMDDEFSGTDSNPVAGEMPQDYASPNLLQLTDVNQDPTEVKLDPKTVQEGVAGAFVGFLSTTDPDTSDTHTYVLANCPNFTEDQGDLEIPVGADYLKLKNNRTADFGTNPTYEVCVRAEDSYGARYFQTFVVQVVQGNQPPTANDDGSTANPIIVKGPTDIDVINGTAPVVADTDPNLPNDTLTIQSVTDGTRGMVINHGTHVTYVATDPTYVNQDDTFSYTIVDQGGLTDSANVTVKVRRDNILGNCNGKSGLDAGDLTAWGLEFFDGDDNSKWYMTPNSIGGGTFDGSPYGCNANQSTQIDAGDLTCIGTLYFGGTCPPPVLAASTTASATLAVAGDIAAAPGAQVEVPVLLTKAGHAVAAAAFAVDFDSSKVSFDATDANADGIPDAVKLNAPANAFTVVTYNEAEGRVEIIISGAAPPFALLEDGALATITFTVNADAAVGNLAIDLNPSSLGSDEGQPVPLQTTDGAIEVTIEGQSLNNVIYLPNVQR